MKQFVKPRADQVQPRDDPARVIAESAETAIARAITTGIDALRGTLHLPAIEAAVRENHFDALWRHLALERVGPYLRPALNRLAVVHDRVAHDVTLSIPVAKARPSRLKTPAVIPLTYDPLASATVSAQNAANAQIIANVEDTANLTAQDVLSQGLAAGLSPQTIARTLRDTLGMSPAEERAISNFRAALESGGAGALDRALRDRRFDRSIRAGDLSESQIDRMVSRYAERYRAFRALRIAKTESLRAANMGKTAAWAQWSESTGRDVRRFWLTAMDELVCPICRPIPDLNPDGVNLEEFYQTPIGPLAAPPDPHPQCRCTERFAEAI